MSGAIISFFKTTSGEVNLKKPFLPTSVVLISLLMFSSKMAMADTLPIKPGKYEVLTSTGIRNDRLSEPKKTTRCLRAEEMVNLDYVFNTRVINAYKPDATCKAGDLEVKDGKMIYSADCQFEKLSVEGFVSETAYGVTRTAKSKASGGVSLISTIEGKRIGECR